MVIFISESARHSARENEVLAINLHLYRQVPTEYKQMSEYAVLRLVSTDPRKKWGLSLKFEEYLCLHTGSKRICSDWDPAL